MKGIVEDQMLRKALTKVQQQVGYVVYAALQMFFLKEIEYRFQCYAKNHCFSCR